MKQPTIDDAKKLAYALRAKGVLILAFGDTKCAGSSYGMTRKQCDGMRQILDDIFGAIDREEIAIPESIREGS